MRTFNLCRVVRHWPEASCDMAVNGHQEGHFLLC